jgi:DNA-binding CsgD family transcriptional regulator
MSSAPSTVQQSHPFPSTGSQRLTLVAPDLPTGRRRRRGPGGLTRRELEVLRHVATGATNRTVASTLWVTDQTVKFHLSNIYRKLGVSNRFEASRWAWEQRLLGPGESEPADEGPLAVANGG